MQNVCRVNVFQRPQHLVDKVLNMVQAQTLFGINDSVQIRLHQFTDNVDILKIVHIPHHGRHHIINAHNIFVLEMLEQLDLAKDALGIDLILKRLGHHLDGHAVVQMSVLCRNDDPVRSRSNHAGEGILGVDRKRVIPRLERVRAVGSGAFEPIVGPAVTRVRSSAVGHDDFGPVFRGDGSIVHGHGVASRVGCEGGCGRRGEAVIVFHVGASLADGAAALVAHGSSDL
mmetsp:Transcript_12372/g.22331  ORF Transcript_12372/g.22331 Transcript_12372/m.22331 type:complete len:229 (-) Transcript_12372:314-1000(-)